jgi:hypothetical protein
VTTRTRAIAYGSAGTLVLAGVVCAIFVGGELGQLLTFVLGALGLGAAVLLVFYEVGLSEDRERAREAERRRPATPPIPPRRLRQGRRFKRRP